MQNTYEPKNDIAMVRELSLAIKNHEENFEDYSVAKGFSRKIVRRHLERIQLAARVAEGEAKPAQA